MSDFFKLLDTEQYGQVLVVRGGTTDSYQQYIKIIAEPPNDNRIELHCPVCCAEHQAMVFNDIAAGGVSKIISEVVRAYEVAAAHEEKQYATEH